MEGEKRKTKAAVKATPHRVAKSRLLGVLHPDTNASDSGLFTCYAHKQ